MKTEQIVETETHTKTLYRCENCGQVFSSPEYIHNCIFCGQEFCERCNPNFKSLPILDDKYLDSMPPDAFSFINYLECNFQKIFCCKSCNTKLITEKQYDAKFSKIVKDFRNQLKQLNIQVKKGK